ncbi:MAG TPA: GNAT family N-acetyltransferase [Opitutales bacterium]|nr:GNAT family N-acetyltransferase [Opitutales bacterium]
MQSNQSAALIRPATLAEVPALNTLIQSSARGLSTQDYSPEAIEGLIQHVFGVDTELITDGSYYVIEQTDVTAPIIACGGWSRRRTLFGGDNFQQREGGYLDPAKDSAKIRAFFVHPSYARQGLARRLLEYCEQQAKAFGFKKMELMSTLPGIKFYGSNGYNLGELVDHTLASGLVVQIRPVFKELG